MEQQGLFNKYDHDSYNQDSVNQYVREYFLEMYTCPSDSNADKLIKPESGPGNRINYRTGSFRANSGRGRPSTKIFLP